MKNIIIFYAIVCISWLHASTTSNTVSDPYENINYFQLSNGLKVYLLSDKKAEKTQISIKVKVGMDIEDESNYGISHLVEHIVFRDQRVPYHDYLDYIKEEGGTYVNGYTTRYTTEYLTTIDSNKSYWITEIFAQMIFDKNVTNRDLDIEKGALQTEIGEINWYEKFLWNIGEFFVAIFPTTENFYTNTFEVNKTKDLPPSYLMKENNKLFTLDEVMSHYKDYYYPANMRLHIVGNFEIPKMKKLIEKEYGVIEIKGIKSTQKPPYDAKLNHKIYQQFFEGTSESMGYIGIKYLLNDCKENIIIHAYVKNLALKIQQKLRNKDGKTYSVSPYFFAQRGGGVASIYFDGLHDDFEENIKNVQQMIADDIKMLNDKDILKALKSYKKRYISVEHDSDSLTKLVNRAEHLRNIHKIDESTHYELFASITPKEFKEVIKNAFVPQNSYQVIYRDYYFFPQDVLVLNSIFMLIFILFYFNIYRNIFLKRNFGYSRRGIIFSRRVTNRFISFLLFLFLFLFSTIIWEWIKYLLADAIMGNPYYVYTIDVPYSYLVTILDEILSIVIFMVIYKLWDYHAKVDITNDFIYIMGSNYYRVAKLDIKQIKSVQRREAKWRDIIGISPLFWKPLVKIETNNGKVYYLRTNNSLHLEEDLTKWLSTS